VTTVHHIVPEKFNQPELDDFKSLDVFTHAYHVPNVVTYAQVRALTTKPIYIIPYWANQNIWRRTGDPLELRRKHGIPPDSYTIGSFQRDTEGGSVVIGNFKPKMEKGPDILCDYVFTNKDSFGRPVHVVLAGWRRQYVIARLESMRVPYTYVEMPEQAIVNELYQVLDLYPITSRYEGGPQSLIEAGLLRVPVVSRDVGMASRMLPEAAVNDDLDVTKPAIPFVGDLLLPNGYLPYRNLMSSVLQSELQ
jgi:glycosyltransferase involved in cell wall biosynthesis